MKGDLDCVNRFCVCGEPVSKTLDQWYTAFVTPGPPLAKSTCEVPHTQALIFPFVPI